MRRDLTRAWIVAPALQLREFTLKNGQARANLPQLHRVDQLVVVSGLRCRDHVFDGFLVLGDEYLELCDARVELRPRVGAERCVGREILGVEPAS